MKKFNTSRSTVLVGLCSLVVGLLIGWIFFKNSTKGVGDHAELAEKEIVWTCSMHPQIRKSESGQCPICGMDLIPMSSESADIENPMEIKMSPTAMQLANVQTSIVSRQRPIRSINLNGRVKADERRVFSQSSHIPGRIEKLNVGFTGERIDKGQVLAYVYSPKLVTAQEELFEADKIKNEYPQLYKAAREKLLNWKLTDSQIDGILKQGDPQEQFPILADVSGIVLNKKVNLGDYVNTGQALFEVVDLSRVWVMFDVYENDLTWVKSGMKIDFSVHSFPGEKFKGSISFLDPIINPNTRVASARVEISNSNMKLKPDMFATGTVKSPVKQSGGGIVILKSAVMWTGERSIVYVKQNNKSGISFMMREVALGPSLGDSYIILEGLKEGEEIATHGTFSIDAAAQLAGKPSMMNPEGGASSSGHDHGGGYIDKSFSGDNVESVNKNNGVGVKQALSPLFEKYLLLKDKLVADNFEGSQRSARSFLSELQKVDMKVFKGDSHMLWMKHKGKSEDALESILAAENIGQARRGFRQLSNEFVLLAEQFGPLSQTLYIQHCPMANSNQGADWISETKKINNPYFGSEMLSCGSNIQTIN